MIGCGKDVFYRFAQNDRIDWRKLLYHLTLQLWSKIRVRSDHKNRTTCLIVDDTDFGKTGKQGSWNGLITTDLSLDFFEAYRIYAQRWSLEVVFKDSKSLLGLGKCQARDFASQIACASLAAIQYNLLSVVKRFNAYETIGTLFRETCSGAMELTIVERIWGAVLEMIIALTNVFNITDEEIYDAVINQSDELAHICDIYRLKWLSRYLVGMKVLRQFR